MSGFETLTNLVKDKINLSGVLIADLHPCDFSVPEGGAFPLLSELVFHLQVVEGTLEAVIDNVRYECSPQENNFLDVKPMNKVSLIRPGKNFRGTLVGLSKQFLFFASKKSNILRINDILVLKGHCAVTLPREDADRLIKSTELLKWTVPSTQERLDYAIFTHAALLYHLSVIKVIKETVPPRDGSQNYSHAELILDRFYRLLEENVKKEHEVTFYAEKLRITSHYLSMVTNRYIGKSASKVITDELLLRSFAMLSNPDVSIQSVAENLGFSNQSSFGKFFRKHAGTTPASYRRSVLG